VRNCNEPQNIGVYLYDLPQEHEGKAGYGFLEAAEFNYQYWQGHTDLGHYEMRMPLI
jgi:hypothetical protein